MSGFFGGFFGEFFGRLFGLRRDQAPATQLPPSQAIDCYVAGAVVGGSCVAGAVEQESVLAGAVAAEGVPA